MNAKYATATEALQTCLRVWEWLAQHPENSKYEAYAALELSHDFCNCPACQYAKDQLVDTCENEAARCQHCPLYPNETSPWACERWGEPYQRWGSTLFDEATVIKAAQSMCTLIQQRITELAKEPK